MNACMAIMALICVITRIRNTPGLGERGRACGDLAMKFLCIGVSKVQHLPYPSQFEADLSSKARLQAAAPDSYED